MPAATPDSTPTPAPPTTPQPGAVVSPDGSFNITEGTVGRDVIASLTEAETSCVRDESGAEAFESLQERRVLAGQTWLDSFPVGCLAEERAIAWSIALVAGTAGGLSATSRECLGTVYADSGAVGLGFVLGDEFPRAEDIETGRFVFHFLTCLTDDEAEALAQESSHLDLGIPPSDLRCLFESVEVETFTDFLWGYIEAKLGEPSAEFLEARKAVSSAADGCEIDYLRHLEPPPVAEERLLWRFRASSYVLGSPVVGDGFVFVRADDVYALNAATGELLWRTPVAGQAWMTLADGTLFVTSGSRLQAIDAADGDVSWSFETGQIYESIPAVARGTVYVGSWNNHLYAVDAVTGGLDWSYKTGGGVRSSPAVSGGVVYFRSNDGLLYALDAATGAVRWTYRIGEPLGHYQSATVSGGTVFTGADDHLFAIDATSGELLWRSEGGTQSDTRLAVADGVLYSNSGHFLVAVDVETGAHLWEFPTGWGESSPTVHEGIVYIGSFDGYLYAIDAKAGKAVWRFRTGGQIHSTPAVEGDVVYFGSADDHLYAVSTAAEVPVRVAPTPSPASLEGVAVLTPDPPSHYQDVLRQFRAAVAMSGDGATIAVGDSKKFSERKYDGAVYVFTRVGQLWGDLAGAAAAKLLPPEDNDWEPVPDDRDWVELTSSFGRSVAVSADGGTIVVGAPDNLPHGYDSGAAYVFTRPSDGWQGGAEAVTLTASDGAPHDRFGHAVAISADGETIVVGSSKTYVFAKPGGGWVDSTETARLTVPGGGGLGDSVAVSRDGDTVFVGASEAAHGGVRPGAVYVFTRSEPAWTDATASARLMSSDGSEDDLFGYELAASDDGATVVAGAPKKDAYGNDQGAAYVYVRPESGWADTVETAKLTASDGARDDRFGLSLATTADGGRFVVGTMHAHVLDRSGTAYIFDKPAGGWEDATETAEFPNPEDQPRGLFGTSVTVSGETFAVGMHGIAVYVFNPASSGDSP